MLGLGAIGRCYSVTFQRCTPHAPARVWQAVTDPRGVARWMGYPARIDLRVGGQYVVDFEGPGKGGLDGVITRVECERTLRYVWGLAVVGWELEPHGGGCRYRFVHHGQNPRGIPDEEGLPAGWHVWLEDLECHLDGAGTPHQADSPRWRQLKRRYRPLLESALGESLGPPA